MTFEAQKNLFDIRLKWVKQVVGVNSKLIQTCKNIREKKSRNALSTCSLTNSSCSYFRRLLIENIFSGRTLAVTALHKTCVIHIVKIYD